QLGAGRASEGADSASAAASGVALEERPVQAERFGPAADDRGVASGELRVDRFHVEQSLDPLEVGLQRLGADRAQAQPLVPPAPEPTMQTCVCSKTSDSARCPWTSML